MGITGKGRCNLTNSCSMADFIAHTPGHGKFLFSAYQQFTNLDLLDKLNGWGLLTKEERGGRIFPQSDSAIEVRKLFYHKLCRKSIELHLKEALKPLNLGAIASSSKRIRGLMRRCLYHTTGACPIL